MSNFNFADGLILSIAMTSIIGCRAPEDSGSTLAFWNEVSTNVAYSDAQNKINGEMAAFRSGNLGQAIAGHWAPNADISLNSFEGQRNYSGRNFESAFGPTADALADHLGYNVRDGETIFAAPTTANSMSLGGLENGSRTSGALGDLTLFRVGDRGPEQIGSAPYFVRQEHNVGTDNLVTRHDEWFGEQNVRQGMAESFNQMSPRYQNEAIDQGFYNQGEYNGLGRVEDQFISSQGNTGSSQRTGGFEKNYGSDDSANTGGPGYDGGSSDSYYQ